jgi:hypothetical protein
MKLSLACVIVALGLFISDAAIESQSVDEACRIGSNRESSGRERAICERLSRRWNELVGEAPAPGVIHLTDRLGFTNTIGSAAWTLEVPREYRSGRLDPGARINAHYAQNIIPHEAGHQLFAVLAGPLTSRVRADEYGTSAPDWFDESFAVWMESAKLRRERLEAIRGSRPSLATLVTRIHPNTRMVRGERLEAGMRPVNRLVVPPCARCTWRPESLRTRYEITDVGTRADGRPDTVIWYSDVPPPGGRDAEDRQFYGLAYSLLRYIHITGGQAAIRELVSRYRIDPRPRVEVLSALPGLPASVQAFEKGWHDFLARPPVEEN